MAKLASDSPQCESHVENAKCSAVQCSAVCRLLLACQLQRWVQHAIGSIFARGMLKGETFRLAWTGDTWDYVQALVKH
jgi:hypothetical protein